MFDTMGSHWFNFVGYADLEYLRRYAEFRGAEDTVDELSIIIDHLDDQFLPGDGIGFFPDNRYQRMADAKRGIVRN